MALTIEVKCNFPDTQIVELEYDGERLVVTRLDSPALLQEIIERVKEAGFEDFRLSAHLMQVIFELASDHGNALTDKLRGAIDAELRGLLSYVRVTNVEINQNSFLSFATELVAGELEPLDKKLSISLMTVRTG